MTNATNHAWEFITFLLYVCYHIPLEGDLINKEYRRNLLHEPEVNPDWTTVNWAQLSNECQ